jgi:hypothetical protein
MGLGDNHLEKYWYEVMLTSHNSLAQVSLIYINLPHVTMSIVQRDLPFANTSNHCETVKEQCITDMAMTGPTQREVSQHKKNGRYFGCVSRVR